MAVVAQPGAELMGAAEAFDAAHAGLEEPWGVVAGLEGPVGHAKGHGGDGEGVAGGELGRGGCALEDVDEIGEVLRRVCGGVLWSAGLGCGGMGESGSGYGAAGALEECPACYGVDRLHGWWLSASAMAFSASGAMMA